MDYKNIIRKNLNDIYNNIQSRSQTVADKIIAFLDNFK